VTADAPSYAKDSTGPPEAPTIGVTFFKCRTDTAPWQREMVLSDFILQLSHHNERVPKDGSMFACVTYRAGETRSNAGIEHATAIVLDVDTEPDWSLLEPYHYATFTSHSHGTTKPQAWRLVLFLAAPIAASEFDEAWARVTHHLCPNADPGAKPLAQPHYLPSHPPGAPCEAREHPGALLDWQQLEALPPPPPRQQRVPGTARSDRPGDDFNARADMGELLEQAGGVYVTTRRDGTELWRRPGKDDDWSATYNYMDSGVFYPFTSNWPPFEQRRSYDPFGVYAALYHGGDMAAAARELGAKGYGAPAPTFEIPTEPSPPEPPGSDEAPADAANNEPAHHTDMGNAQVFAHAHGAALRYCYRFGAWYTWTARRWEEDERGMVERRAKRTVLDFYRRVAELEDDAARKALVTHARRSEAAGRVEAMVRLARSEPGIAIMPDDLDRDHWLLNCLNGTVDLRTGELRPHNPADLITKLIPIPYDAAAPCPQWEAFLGQVVPDPAVRRFLQRAVGYAATGDTREQALFFPFGSGANGKSTFLSLVMAALGDYAKQAAPELLTYSKNDRHPTELADLVGVRFVASIEVDEGKRLAEALVKQMTGGDRMKARRMRENFFDFTPTHKIFLAANHRPIVRGTDHAIWRRIHLIPFEVTIPPEQQDKQLPTKLYGELPGILRWIVEGCLEWQQEGLGVPEAVKQATNEYRADQDVLGAFLEDECEVSPTATVTSKALYAAYMEWCRRTGETPIGQRWLGPRLLERGFQSVHNRAARMWVGLQLRPDRDATSGE
jgi:P4 family phage/plasmid primase-like protien